MINLKKLVFLLFILLIYSNYSFGLKIPEKPDAYINDYAGILNSSQELELNQKLKTFENQSSIQIFVAIFKSLENQNLEDFSIRLAEKWKPGQKNKDNGVLITLFMQERKVRIEVGYGLESVLTDALSGIIIRKELAPEFQKGNYYQGIKNTVTKIVQITGGTFTNEQIKEYKNNKMNIFSMIFYFVLGFIFLIFFIRHPILALMLFRGVVIGGRGSSSFGGFSGGGGGSFGGGGSSGGW